jgi:hypothetical protein
MSLSALLTVHVYTKTKLEQSLLKDEKENSQTFTGQLFFQSKIVYQ